MRIRLLALLATCCLALSVTAYAATVYMPNVSSLAPGWSTSVVADSAARGGVYNKTVLSVNGFQFTQGDANKTSGCRSILGTNNYDGLLLSQITALKARVLYIEGDQSPQPPKFILKLQKAPDNASDRTLEWIPFSDGVALQSNVWMELDAMVDGSWICPNAGDAVFLTLADALATYPGLMFTSSAAYFPLVTHSFNLGQNNWVSNTTKYNDNERGVCDWFEVGVDGVTTRYDLYDIPEPGSLLALGTGLIGLLGIVRRRR